MSGMSDRDDFAETKTSKLKFKVVNSNDKNINSTIRKLENHKAMLKIQDIYLKKQPGNIMDFLEQQKAARDETTVVDPMEPNSIQAKIQEKLENEALELSPSEINDQAKQEGSSAAIARAKRNQALKFMQSETSRLLEILQKHDPMLQYEDTLKAFKTEAIVVSIQDIAEFEDETP